jgi:hypothetical protein
MEDESQLCSKKHNLESEDSSYDSDCEVSDGTHYDVSRTVSDTLGQEFDEYVTNGTCAGDSPFSHHKVRYNINYNRNHDANIVCCYYYSVCSRSKYYRVTSF